MQNNIADFQNSAFPESGFSTLNFDIGKSEVSCNSTFFKSL